MRKYVPAGVGSSGEAAILFVHGGGCVLGDIETHDICAARFCHDTRATVFSLDYRLAPEHPFPAAVEDTVAALTGCRMRPRRSGSIRSGSHSRRQCRRGFSGGRAA